jgi:hypothetical protein
MNLKAYAEQEGLTLKEAKSITGLTHWNQTVTDAPAPESCDELPEIEECDTLTIEELFEEVVDEAPEEIVSDEPIDETSPEAKKRSVKGLGTKSPYWKELRG